MLVTSHPVIHRTITDEWISSFFNTISNVIPSSCVLLSIDDGSNIGSPVPLPRKATEFTPNENLVSKKQEEVTSAFIQKIALHIIALHIIL